ncbi:MAG: hypothetical protein ABI397_00115 [Candidatus Saccharimonas sp.]
MPATSPETINYKGPEVSAEEWRKTYVELQRRGEALINAAQWADVLGIKEEE